MPVILFRYIYTYIMYLGIRKGDRVKNNLNIPCTYLFIAPKLPDRSYYMKITFLPCEIRGFVR